MIIFFLNDTATTEIYTLSLHDALPILSEAGTVCELACMPAWYKPNRAIPRRPRHRRREGKRACFARQPMRLRRSEEHTSELQSRQYLVCRLLLEKKNYTLPSSLPCVDS